MKIRCQLNTPKEQLSSAPLSLREIDYCDATDRFTSYFGTLIFVRES